MTKTCSICGDAFIPYYAKPTQFLCSKKSCRQKHANIKNTNYKARWTQENRERLNELTKQWCKQNPEKRAKSSSEYRKRNKPYYAEQRSLRSRRLLQAKPRWADTTDIMDVYKEAEYFQLEVDHIIPLKHPLVCGLHVWNNLQLLSRSENAKKSNKFDIDILCVLE